MFASGLRVTLDSVGTGQTILTRKTKTAIFLTLLVDDGGEDAVRDTLSELAGRVRSVGSRAPEAALTTIAAIGSDAWGRLYDGARPAGLHPFRALTGDVHHAPSTPGDLLLHIKADQLDLCYEVARILIKDLDGAATVIEEIHGFRYFDLRDLTGFVDGTENPVGQAALDAILVGDEDPAFAGGSYVAVQRYVTDFDEWDALPTPEQENVFGRTKLENVEMADDVKPSNSHIALNVVEDDEGNELKIIRDNMPYGDAAGSEDRGTYFIAYSKTPDVTERMLENMFLGDPPGNYDRLLDFTTAVTGAQFFAPPVEFLEDPPPAPAAPEPEAAVPSAHPRNGSLGIGSLR